MSLANFDLKSDTISALQKMGITSAKKMLEISSVEAFVKFCEDNKIDDSDKSKLKSVIEFLKPVQSSNHSVESLNEAGDSESQSDADSESKFESSAPSSRSSNFSKNKRRKRQSSKTVCNKQWFESKKVFNKSAFLKTNLINFLPEFVKSSDDSKEKRSFKKASEIVFAYSNLIYKLQRENLLDIKGACSLLSHVGYCLESGVQSCSQFWDLLMRDCSGPQDISKFLKKYNYNIVKETNDDQSKSYRYSNRKNFGTKNKWYSKWDKKDNKTE